MDQTRLNFFLKTNQKKPIFSDIFIMFFDSQELNHTFKYLNDDSFDFLFYDLNNDYENFFFLNDFVFKKKKNKIRRFVLKNKKIYYKDKFVNILSF